MGPKQTQYAQMTRDKAQALNELFDTPDFESERAEALRNEIRQYLERNQFSEGVYDALMQVVGDYRRAKAERAKLLEESTPPPQPAPNEAAQPVPQPLPNPMTKRLAVRPARRVSDEEAYNAWHEVMAEARTSGLLPAIEAVQPQETLTREGNSEALYRTPTTELRAPSGGLTLPVARGSQSESVRYLDMSFDELRAEIDRLTELRNQDIRLFHLSDEEHRDLLARLDEAELTYRNRRSELSKKVTKAREVITEDDEARAVMAEKLANPKSRKQDRNVLSDVQRRLAEERLQRAQAALNAVPTLTEVPPPPTPEQVAARVARNREAGEAAQRGRELMWQSVGERDLSGALPSGFMRAVEGESRQLVHSDPALNGKPILAEAADGRVIVANADNANGISIVRDQAERQTEGLGALTPSEPTERRTYQTGDIGVGRIRPAQTEASAPEASSTPAPSLEVVKHFHTKRNVDTWVVRIGKRVSDDLYKQLLREAKASKGWFSKTYQGSPEGFAFTDEAKARQFAEKNYRVVNPDAPAAAAPVPSPLGGEKSFAGMAEREQQAYEGMLETIMELGGLTREQAQTVYDYYDGHNMFDNKDVFIHGRKRVKHGAYLERDVLRRVAGLYDGIEAPFENQPVGDLPAIENQSQEQPLASVEADETALPENEPQLSADAQFLLRLIREEGGGSVRRLGLNKMADLTNSRLNPAIKELTDAGLLVNEQGTLRIVEEAAQQDLFASPSVSSVESEQDATELSGTNESGLSEDGGAGNVRAPRVRKPSRSGSQSSGEGSGRAIRPNDRGQRANGFGQRNDAGQTQRADESGNNGSGQDSGTRRDGKRDVVILEPVTSDDARTESQQPSATARPGNYTITDIDALVPNGKMGKLRANFAALRLWLEITGQGRSATAQEQEILAQYTGWGQFPDLFNDINDAGKKLADERAELKAVLTPEEYEAAKRSTLNAHYTSPEIVNAMWQMVQRLGFKKGRVLEPSMGIGNFFGLMPAKLREVSKLVGVELDRITGGMARLLYPDATVQVKGFEQHNMPDGFYDLVIGNVPFGAYKVHDPAYNRLGANIHDYFIIKSLDKTRAGGVVAVITSTGTMDKAEPRLRRAMADRADLVAAIRFPEGAFEKNAGTAVVTDLLIFQKRKPGQAANDAWVEFGTLPDADGGEAIPISKYFVEHPEMILGRLDRKSRMYAKNEPHVSRTDDFEERLAKAIASLPENIMGKREQADTMPEGQTVEGNLKVAEGGLVIKGNKVYRRRGDQLLHENYEAKQVERLERVLSIRDALAEITQAQLSGEKTISIRTRLNALYDAFVKKFGALRKTTNAKLLAGDPSKYLVLALEESYDAKTGKAKKAALFERDIIAKAGGKNKVETPGEAVAVSLYEQGELDIDRIAKLLNVTPEEAGRKLVEQELAFETPSGNWETAERYLSGNVRKKLAEAQAATELDGKFNANVNALRKVQPADIDIADITIKMGASWVPAEDVTDFAAHLMETDAASFDIKFVPTSATWIVERNRAARASLGAKASEVYGTSRMNFLTLLSAGLNDEPVVVYDYDEKKNRSVNLDETEKAQTKLQDIKEAFQEWIWTDPARASRLHRYYNDNFNNVRLVHYSGEHYRNSEGKFVLPGMNPAIELRPHQVKDIWQAVSNGKLLDASEVGAGKTFIMGAIAMEWRRLGMSRKPAIVVPKSRIAPTVAELQTLYPAAKILSFARDFDKENRKQTTANLATGDYDFVVMTHDQFGKIQMRPEYVERWISRELEEIEARIAEASAGLSEKELKGNRVVKQLENVKARVEAKLKDALDATNKDDAIYFEDTGIDGLLVDEAHGFKSLPVYSRRDGLKGVPTSRSDKASNMFMVSRFLMENNGGKGLVLATGTPVSNTLAELYNMQRYLQYDELQERGIDNFDAWADLFTEATTNYEYKATGEYSLATRLTDFVNIPELQAMVRQVMATNFVDDMPWITRPQKREEVVSVDMSAEQVAFLKTIRQRAERLKKMKPAERKASKDNFLVLSTDARKSALSSELIDPMAKGKDNKIAAVVDKVARIRRERPGMTQMIFLDMGVNETKWGYSAYNEIIERLEREGIPRERIANFSTMTDRQRELAADKLNAGEYWVGVGSSQKMGTGVNAQKRLTAMHHVDTHWVPAYLEQRNGRGHRQGNENETVEAYYYTTKGSFDLVMWQAVVRKLKAITQFMRGESGRVMRFDDTGDEDSGELSFETIMAATSDNPYEFDRVKLQGELQRLERQERNHRSQLARIRTMIADYESRIPKQREALKNYDADLEQYRATKGAEFSVEIGGKIYEKRDVADMQLAIAVKQAPSGADSLIGNYRGFEIRVQKVWNTIYLQRNGIPHRFSLDITEPKGAFASADANLRGIASDRQHIETSIESMQRDIEQARPELLKPFKKAEQLAETRRRVDELEQQIIAYQAAAKAEALAAKEEADDPLPATGTNGPDYMGAGLGGLQRYFDRVPKKFDFTKLVTVTAARMKADKREAAEVAQAVQLLRRIEAAAKANNGAAFQDARGQLRNLVEGNWFKRRASNAGELVNFARSVRLSLDMPHLRQGLFLTAPPRYWMRAANDTVKAWQSFSDSQWDDFKKAVDKMPITSLADSFGLYLSHRGVSEENFESKWAHQFPITRKVEQAYSTYLDLRRLDAFDRAAQVLSRSKLSADQKQQALKDAARAINILSGRGEVGETIEKAIPLLNKIFLAPRYTVSRFQVPTVARPWNPGYREASKDMLATGLLVSGLAGLAVLTGVASTSFDYDDPDFLKLRVGKKVFDLTAGVGSVAKITSQLAEWSWSQLSGADGERKRVSEETANDAKRFARAKLSPLMAIVADAFSNWTNLAGEKVTLGGSLLRQFVPLFLEDIHKGWQAEGVTGALSIALGGYFGAGATLYDESPLRKSPLAADLTRFDLPRGNLFQLPNESPELFEARKKRYEQLVREFGGKLADSAIYQKASDAEKQGMLRRLVDRMKEASNERQPSLLKLTPGILLRDVRGAAADARNRSAKQQRERYVSAP